MSESVGLTTPTYSPLESPFLSSYAGLSSPLLEGLATIQASYQRVAPVQNQLQALQSLQAAQSATDPNLQMQLLVSAIQELTPQGGSNPQPVVNQSGQPVATSAPTAAPAPACNTGSLSVNTATNTIDTGRYLISGSTGDDGSLTITDKQTGKTVEAWGDPHLKVNGQNVADFQKDGLNIQLQDGTVVHIQPTALSNGVAHINQVSVTQGDEAVTMSGFKTGGVQTSQVMNDASYQNSLYNTPNVTDVTMGTDGNLYYNNANGSMGSEITTTNGGQTDLDGAGGGLVNQSGGGTASGGASAQSVMEQLIQAIQMNATGLQQMMMMMGIVREMMSQSGYMTN
jgi:hypothetical protein